jgi:hypothetical protein
MFLNRNKYNKLFVVVALFFVSTLFPLITLADGEQVCNPNSGVLCNPLKPGLNSVPALFEAVLAIAAQIGAIFIVVGIIYTGFLFVTARGNQEELSKAKKAFTYTIIGAILVLGAWSFSVAIKSTIDAITK